MRIVRWRFAYWLGFALSMEFMALSVAAWMEDLLLECLLFSVLTATSTFVAAKSSDKLEHSVYQFHGRSITDDPMFNIFAWGTLMAGIGFWLGLLVYFLPPAHWLLPIPTALLLTGLEAASLSIWYATREEWL